MESDGRAYDTDELTVLVIALSVGGALPSVFGFVDAGEALAFTSSSSSLSFGRSD